MRMLGLLAAVLVLVPSASACDCIYYKVGLEVPWADSCDPERPDKCPDAATYEPTPLEATVRLMYGYWNGVPFPTDTDDPLEQWTVELEGRSNLLDSPKVTFQPENLVFTAEDRAEAEPVEGEPGWAMTKQVQVTVHPGSAVAAEEGTPAVFVVAKADGSGTGFVNREQFGIVPLYFQPAREPADVMDAPTKEAPMPALAGLAGVAVAALLRAPRQREP